MKNWIDKFGLLEFTEQKFVSTEREYFHLMLFHQLNSAYLLMRHITDVQIIIALSVFLIHAVLLEYTSCIYFKLSLRDVPLW